MASSKGYFSDEGMQEKTASQKIASPFLALFHKSVRLLLTLSTYAFLLTILFIIGMLVLEFNFNINKNFYDALKENEKVWFNGTESTNILIDNKTCQTLPLTIDILNKQRTSATYNNFASNLYWTSPKVVNRELRELQKFRKVLDNILLRNDIGKLWVFTRGYADKSNAENVEYALNKNYFYNEVIYYPIRNKIFDITADTRTINMEKNKYKNRDLIYLRANFVKEKYYQSLLNNLKFRNYDLAILEGKILDKRDKNFRKVNVYMSFCKKSENLTVLDKLHHLKTKLLLHF